MKLWKQHFSRLPIVILCAHVLVLGYIADAPAEPFQNLGFEDAVVVPPLVDGWQAPVSQALPYWRTSNYLAGYVGYDTLSLGAVCVSIHDDLSNAMKPLKGQYSVFLQSGAGGPLGQPTSAYISQVGDVPSSARSLMFTSDDTEMLDRLIVSLNGTAIPMQLYSVGGTVNSYWGPMETFVGDISAFTGQMNVELRFEQTFDPAHPYRDSGSDLDAIHFSSLIVAEPSTLILLTVAALAASARIFRRRRVE